MTILGYGTDKLTSYLFLVVGQSNNSKTLFMYSSVNLYLLSQYNSSLLASLVYPRPLELVVDIWTLVLQAMVSIKRSHYSTIRDLSQVHEQGSLKIFKLIINVSHL